MYAVYKNIKEKIPLNDSGNVYVLLKIEVNGKITLEVKAKNLSGDMQIDRSKWDDMARKLGVYYANNSSGLMSWGASAINNIHFEVNGIDLPTDSSYLFCGLRGEIKGCEKVNTSKVTDMRSMFQGIDSADPDVSRWNTSNVTNMASMFQQGSANPDVSKWNTSKVTDMRGMFAYSGSANPDVSKWDVSKVTNMQSMFRNTGIREVDLSKWKFNAKLLENPERCLRCCAFLKTRACIYGRLSRRLLQILKY